MPIINFREALKQAIDEEMQRDKSVFMIGEEVGASQGAYKVSEGLLDQFGEMRMRDTPIAEEMIVGLAIGAALGGLRPIAEMMTFNFSLLALDQIVNHAAKIRYMSGGQLKVPIVVRGPGGAAFQLGAQHSQSLEIYFAYVPGLKVVMPSVPADAKGLLKSAIRDDNPVIFIESEVLYGLKGEVPEGDYTIPLGVGDVKRVGEDVTVVAYSKMLHVALAAAAQLERQGISLEVVDPRTIRPLDEAMIIDSVNKTRRCVIVEEAWGFGGVGAELAALISSRVFDHLLAPVVRVSAVEVPTPYSKPLEEATIPHPARVIAAVKQVMRSAERREAVHGG